MSTVGFVCDWIYLRKNSGRSLQRFVLFFVLHEKFQFFGRRMGREGGWGEQGILDEVRNGLRECAIRVVLAMLAFLYCLNLKKVSQRCQPSLEEQEVTKF